MNDLTMISFQMISHIGEAKSKFIESYRLARQLEFEKAEQVLKEGEISYIKGHETHAGLIQQEALGNNVIPNLLLLHAEDQLASAEVFQLMAVEMIETYKKINHLEKEIKEMKK